MRIIIQKTFTKFIIGKVIKNCLKISSNNACTDSNYEKSEPVAVIREMRQVQAEISKLQGLYAEKEEEKEGITKEQEEALNEDLESCTD